VLINLVLWAVCGLILAFNSNNHLLGTAALAYSLGLRHALDADHITAIDLMTRRLIATGQRPVTVGTFFSLGHSTIVIITSIVVAATAAGVSKRFDGFSNVGGIIGTSVSAAFLLILGILNAYILYRLVVQIRKVIDLQPDQAAAEAWKIEGGGFLFRVLKRMFKLIDRPWKMYPLGVLFGLGFDTSSEIALLGISSIQGAQGTSIWLILIFPVLFTAGMCLIDTLDGALMMSLYVAPMSMTGDKKAFPQEPEVENQEQEHTLVDLDSPTNNDAPITYVHEEDGMNSSQLRTQVKDPLTFLYYSIVLTTLTVICAIVIGIIQLLSLILNTAHPTGSFWNGVEAAGDNYEIIGGSICASFVVFGLLSVICYRPWRRTVDRRRETLRQERRPDDDNEDLEGDEGRDVEADRREEEVIEEFVDIERLQAKSDGGRDGKKTFAPNVRTIPGQGSGSTA
jgi:nickel/cobalt transporter (NiCoT) family protein